MERGGKVENFERGESRARGLRGKRRQVRTGHFSRYLAHSLSHSHVHVSALLFFGTFGFFLFPKISDSRYDAVVHRKKVEIGRIPSRHAQDNWTFNFNFYFF